MKRTTHHQIAVYSLNRPSGNSYTVLNPLQGESVPSIYRTLISRSFTTSVGIHGGGLHILTVAASSYILYWEGPLLFSFLTILLEIKSLLSELKAACVGVHHSFASRVQLYLTYLTVSSDLDRHNTITDTLT